MRHGFFSTTWNPNARAISGSLQHHQVLTTRTDSQSASQQGDPVAYALLSVQEEMIVKAGQIVAASS